jgi:hypothetical protein
MTTLAALLDSAWVAREAITLGDGSVLLREPRRLREVLDEIGIATEAEEGVGAYTEGAPSPGLGSQR